MNFSIRQTVTYLLDYLDQFGFRQQALILAIDAGNGVILDSVGDTDLMRGNLLGGGVIEIPITHYLQAEVYRVQHNDGNGWSGSTLGHNQVGNLLNQGKVDEETGEVELNSNIGKIKDSSGETVYEKQEKSRSR